MQEGGAMDSSLTTSHSSLLNASHTIASALAPKGGSIARSNVTTTGTSGATSSSSADATDPSTITSSDFLTLLVSELQNQDPTQPTDPNAYISQLVGVNSLQQLISINQGITSLNSTASSGSAAPPASGVIPATDIAVNPNSVSAATSSAPATQSSSF
jgi:flagellar basal-body rod modification protein FlgD